MKAQAKALVASLIIVALGLSAVSGITYSWFSDIQEAQIDVTTARFDVKQELGSAEGGGEEINKVIQTGTDISIVNFAPNALITIPINVSYVSTISVKVRTVVTIEAVGFEPVDKDQIKINDQSLSSVGTELVLMDWCTKPSTSSYEDILRTELVISTVDWNTTPSSDAKTLSMEVKTEMYQGDYITPGTTTGFTGETTLSTGVVSGTTSSSGGAEALPIIVNFGDAAGVSSGMTFKAESKNSSGIFTIGSDSTRAIIDLSLKNGDTPVTFSGKVEITVKMPGDIRPVSVYYNGTEGDQPTDITGTYNEETNETTVVFTTTHFSDFIVFNGLPTNSNGEHCIYNAAHLFAFAYDVNENKTTYSGKTVKLMADIDLNGMEWIPIGQTGPGIAFAGTFDGNKKTISNMTVETKSGMPQRYASGFFGWFSGVVKDLTVDSASVSGQYAVGAIVGDFEFGQIMDCTVSNSTITNTYEGGERTGDKTGGIVGYIQPNSLTVSGNKVKNSIISGCRDVGGIAGIAYDNSIFKNNVIEGENKIILTPKENKGQYNIRDFIGRYGNSFDIDSSNLKVSGATVDRICEITEVDTLEYVLNAWGKRTDLSLDKVIIKLMNDCTYSGTGWNPGYVHSNVDYVHGFGVGSITIDGNGKTISGLDGALLPFIYGQNGTVDVTIKDLTLKNSTVGAGQGPLGVGGTAGAFMCQVGAQAKVTITSCKVISSTIGSDNTLTNYAGGFIGYISNQGDVTISGSQVMETGVSAYKAVGGFVGFSGQKDEMSISDCTVKGCIITSVRSDPDFETGVVIGKLGGDSGIVEITFNEKSLSDNQLKKYTVSLSEVSGNHYVYGTTYSANLSINGVKVGLTFSPDDGIKADSYTAS